MDANFPEDLKTSDVDKLLELQHNLTKVNLEKVRRIRFITVTYMDNLLDSTRQFGSATVLSASQLMTSFAVTYLKFYARDKLEDSPPLRKAWIDAVVDNEKGELWNPDNETPYTRLYNTTLGTFTQSVQHTKCPMSLHFRLNDSTFNLFFLQVFSCSFQHRSYQHLSTHLLCFGRLGIQKAPKPAPSLYWKI